MGQKKRPLIDVLLTDATNTILYIKGQSSFADYKSLRNVYFSTMWQR